MTNPQPPTPPTTQSTTNEKSIPLSLSETSAAPDNHSEMAAHLPVQTDWSIQSEPIPGEVTAHELIPDDLEHTDPLLSPQAVFPETYSNARSVPSETIKLAPVTQSLSFPFLQPTEAPDEIGRLAYYRVFRVLGMGGMGVVFRAEDLHLQRLVALKVMLPEIAADNSSKSRFLREARTMAALKHDHIVTVYQVGEERGTAFLAMEFLQGTPLDRWLRAGHRANVLQLLRLGREIAAGLHLAHQRGLVHRDIKPGNIFLEVPNGRVKLLDFGLARDVQCDEQLTQSGHFVGTPSFMAPEQARGRQVDGRADLFSLGCVLYSLVTGKSPFHGHNLTDVLLALVSDHPTPLHVIYPQFPEPVSLFIEHLLAKQPSDRPSSAQAVVERLMAFEAEFNTALTDGNDSKQGSATFTVSNLPLLARDADSDHQVTSIVGHNSHLDLDSLRNLMDPIEPSQFPTAIKLSHWEAIKPVPPSTQDFLESKPTSENRNTQSPAAAATSNLDIQAVSSHSTDSNYTTALSRDQAKTASVEPTLVQAPVLCQPKPSTWRAHFLPIGFNVLISYALIAGYLYWEGYRIQHATGKVKCQLSGDWRYNIYQHEKELYKQLQVPLLELPVGSYELEWQNPTTGERLPRVAITIGRWSRTLQNSPLPPEKPKRTLKPLSR